MNDDTLKLAVSRIMGHLRNKDCDKARNVIQPILDYYANAWEEDQIPLPELIEQAFLAIELVEGGASPPTT